MPLIFAIQLGENPDNFLLVGLCHSKKKCIFKKCIYIYIYIYTQLWTHTCKHLHYGSVYEGECLHRDGDEMQRQQNGPSHFAREKESESNEKRGGGVGQGGSAAKRGAKRGGAVATRARGGSEMFSANSQAKE